MGPRVLAEAFKLPQLVDLSSDQQNKGLESFCRHRPLHHYRLGISASLIDRTLDSAFGQNQVAINYTQLNQYHVVMEFAPPFLAAP